MNTNQSQDEVIKHYTGTRQDKIGLPRSGNPKRFQSITDFPKKPLARSDRFWPATGRSKSPHPAVTGYSAWHVFCYKLKHDFKIMENLFCFCFDNQHFLFNTGDRQGKNKPEQRSLCPGYGQPDAQRPPGLCRAIGL